MATERAVQTLSPSAAVAGWASNDVYFISIPLARYESIRIIYYVLGTTTKTSREACPVKRRVEYDDGPESAMTSKWIVGELQKRASIPLHSRETFFNSGL